MQYILSSQNELFVHHCPENIDTNCEIQRTETKQEEKKIEMWMFSSFYLFIASLNDIYHVYAYWLKIKGN